MRPAFNTVLFSDDELLAAVAEISAAGFDGVELQPHLTRKLLADGALAAELGSALEQSGTSLCGLMVGFLFDEESLGRQRLGAELARRLGAERLVVLPPRPEMAAPESFGELVAELAASCAELGVSASVHHHAGTVLDTPERIDVFLAELPAAGAGLCFDPAHYALLADDEADAARRYAEAIDFVHVKDLVRRRAELGFVPGFNNAAQSFRQPGDGILELPAALRALAEAGYDGWLSIEVENFYRSRAETLRTTRQYLEETIDV